MSLGPSSIAVGSEEEEAGAAGAAAAVASGTGMVGEGTSSSLLSERPPPLALLSLSDLAILEGGESVRRKGVQRAAM